MENGNGIPKDASHPSPLRPSGKLDNFKHEETTPVVGREYPDLNVVDDLLNSSDADDLIRDLAIASESTELRLVDLRAHSYPFQSPSVASFSCVHSTI